MMRHILWLLVPAVLCLAPSAEARPRDDALSAAIRCGVVPGSRQWLDCYYGAAQPVRAALGLGSALPAQIALAASPPGGGPPQDEAVRNQVVTAAVACMREPADRPWLDCYYAAAMPMRAELGLPTVPRPAPAPQPQLVSLPATPAPAMPAQPATPPPMPRPVGILGGLFSDPKPVVRDVPMQSYIFDKNGAFTVTLPDGQVWEQSAEDEIYHRARWRRPAAEMVVTIKPDAMHTYVLTLSDENYMYKVHRIR
jgi:hypothetical protein